MRVRKRYEYDPDRSGLPHHVWVAECAQGAVHLHITDDRANGTPDLVWGSIELHYRQPPPGRLNDAPDHHNCYFTRGLCWHDGSSAGARSAREYFLKEERGRINNHEYYFDLIEQWLRDEIIRDREHEK